jgi:hypothetical protein
MSVQKFNRVPCKIKSNWLDEGKRGTLYACVTPVGSFNVWAVVVWDGPEDEPELFKAHGLLVNHTGAWESLV